MEVRSKKGKKEKVGRKRRKEWNIVGIIEEGWRKEWWE